MLSAVVCGCCTQVEECAEPRERVFRLDADLPVPKWGKDCDWSSQNDAMLLLGVSWHGLGHWDKLAQDDR
jgi:hypothetical protein